MNRHHPTRRNVLAGTGAIAGLTALPAQAAGRSERVKITKVELVGVVVPMQEDIINSAEFTPDALSEFPKIPKFILKVHTDSGIIGIGETGRGLEEAPVRRNADSIVGKNLLDFDLARI